MITAVIGSQFRQLYAARVALDEGLGAGYVKEVTGKKDYFAGKLLQLAGAWGREELRNAVRLCAGTDWRLKSDNNTTDAELMEELLVRLAMNRKNAAY